MDVIELDSEGVPVVVYMRVMTLHVSQQGGQMMRTSKQSQRRREIHKLRQIQTERDIFSARQMQMRPRNQLLNCKCSWPSLNYCWGQFEIKFRKVFRSQNVGGFFLPLRSVLFSRIGMLMSRYRTIYNIRT